MAALTVNFHFKSCFLAGGLWALRCNVFFYFLFCSLPLMTLMILMIILLLYINGYKLFVYVHFSIDIVSNISHVYQV